MSPFARLIAYDELREAQAGCITERIFPPATFTPVPPFRAAFTVEPQRSVFPRGRSDARAGSRHPPHLSGQILMPTQGKLSKRDGRPAILVTLGSAPFASGGLD